MSIVKWLSHPTCSIGWIVDENGCHIWQGDRSSGGYGRARYKGRLQMVHRVRYELEVGPIPDGFQVDHYVCDNGQGGCCNPQHCRPVTPRENVLRSNNPCARNRASEHCPRGHALSADNLDAHHKNSGRRSCQKCTMARHRAYVRSQQRARSLGFRGEHLRRIARTFYPAFRDEEYAALAGARP